MKITILINSYSSSILILKAYLLNIWSRFSMHFQSLPSSKHLIVALILSYLNHPSSNSTVLIINTFHFPIQNSSFIMWLSFIVFRLNAIQFPLSHCCSLLSISQSLHFYQLKFNSWNHLHYLSTCCGCIISYLHTSSFRHSLLSLVSF